MKFLTVHDMLAWCDGFGIRPDTKWPPPRVLSLGDNCRTYIEVEGRQCLGSEPGLLDVLYQGLQITTFCRMMKRAPFWGYQLEDGQSFNDYLSYVLYHAGFVPVGCEECLEIDAGESALVKRLMLAVILTARSVCDDVFFVPDHGNMLMWIDHHAGCVRITFRSSEAYEGFSAILTKNQIPYDGDVL